MDDIGNFGLPINGAVTPSVQSLSSSSSSSRYRLPKKARVAAVAVRSPRTVKVKQRPHPHAASSSLVPNRKKRGLPTWDIGARHELSSDDEVKELTQHSTNADNATRSVAQGAPSVNNAIRIAKSNSRLSKEKEPKHKQQQSIQSFFHANASQHNSDAKPAPSSDFVTAASMICESDTYEPNRKTCTQLQDTTSLSNRNTNGYFADLLENFNVDESFSDDELIDNSSGDLNAMSNGERDEEIHEVIDRNRQVERCRLNNVEFGIHQCIFGHGLLPTTMEGRNRTNSVKSRLQLSLDAKRRHEQKQRLLHGTCGVNILSRLVQRSCIPTSTSSIASAMEKFANSGRHWNVCNTVELAVSGVDGAGAPYARTNGDIFAMSFDRDGVLLAMGDDRGTVSIYDFDDVYAMDMTKRNEISRLLRQNYLVDTNERDIDEHDTISHMTSEIIKAEDRPDNDSDSIAVHSIPPAAVRPVLSLQCRASSNNTGHRISSILWSPYNQDHLAVSFA